MKKSVAISISKIDAARRQLETAIRLYFANEDPVSVHTLAAASFGVLQDVCKSKKLSVPSFRQMMLDMAEPGREKEVRFHLKRHENFFKHADRDADANIDFNPGATDWVLFDCIVLYHALTGEKTPVIKSFHVWWQYTYRHLLKAEYQEQLQRFAEHEEFFVSRAKFFSSVMPAFSRPFGT